MTSCVFCAQSPVISFLLAAVLAALLTPLACVLARRLGAMDLPSERKIHNRPTPRLGGLAVLAGVLGVAVVTGLPDRAVLGLLAGGVVAFAAGAWDDIRGLSPWWRLVLQTAGAGLAAAMGVHLDLPVGMPAAATVEIAVSMLWLVGMANAVNLIDGIDGLAVTFGILSAALLGLACGSAGFLAAALSGACLGFFPYNRRRARCFLGDGGAGFIGFMLAGLGLLAVHGRGPEWLLLPPAVLALPLWDCVFTTVSRVRRGKVRSVRQWVEYAGRDHLHHRLLERGWTPGRVCLVLAGGSFGLGALVLVLLSGR